VIYSWRGVKSGSPLHQPCGSEVQTPAGDTFLHMCLSYIPSTHSHPYTGAVQGLRHTTHNTHKHTPKVLRTPRPPRLGVVAGGVRVAGQVYVTLTPYTPLPPAWLPMPLPALPPRLGGVAGWQHGSAMTGYGDGARKAYRRGQGTRALCPSPHRRSWYSAHILPPHRPIPCHC
jgi:hypothetical protein